MGLFGVGRERKARAEQVIQEALSHHPAVKIVIENVINPPEEHQWLNTVCSYYDSRVRTVIVGKDVLSVHFCSPSDFDKKDHEHPSVGVAFTDLGYTPLPAYKETNGELILDVGEVAEVLAEIVKMQISEACPNYVLGNVFVETDNNKMFQAAYFTYRLPSLQWKSWF